MLAWSLSSKRCKALVASNPFRAHKIGHHSHDVAGLESYFTTFCSL